MIADINNLALIVTSEVRRLRLNDEVVSQVPVAQSPRRADNTVAVVVEIPAVPPPLAALLGLVVVAGGIAAIRTPKPKPGNGTNGQHPEPPKGHVILKPVTGPPTPAVLNDEGHKTLVSAAFTLHFDVLNDPISLTTEGNSLVESEEWHNG